MKINKKQIAIILVILVLIIISINIIIKKINEAKIQKNPVQPQVEIQKPREYGKLGLSEVSVFFDYYTGEFWASDVGSFLNDIYTNYIPTLYNNLKNADEQKIIDYYYNNNIDIRRFLGCAGKEEFVTFINALQKSNINFNDWESVHILPDTFVDNSDKDGYAYCEYVFSTINGNTMNFSLYVSHEKSKIPNFIILANE